MKCLKCGREIDKPFVGSQNGPYVFREWRCSCEFGWSVNGDGTAEYRRRQSRMTNRWYSVPEGCLLVMVSEEEL